MEQSGGAQPDLQSIKNIYSILQIIQKEMRAIIKNERKFQEP
jgi:hypothetical protein